MEPLYPLKKLALNYSNRFVSKWLVLSIDLFLTFSIFVFSFLLRFNLSVEKMPWEDVEHKLLWMLAVYGFSFFVFRSFSGVIRHTSLNDAIRVAKASFFAASLLIITSFFTGKTSLDEFFFIPNSVILIHFFINLIVLVGSRALFKLGYFRVLESSRDKLDLQKTKVLIYGAGQSGIVTKNTLLQEKRVKYHIVAFLDDNPSMAGKKIQDIPVLCPKRDGLDNILEQAEAEEVVIAIQNVHPERKRRMIDACLKHQMQVKVVPSIKSWVNGEFNAKQLKQVRIEDLLGRDPINLDKENVANEVADKVVLVTGAAGSIGSEISRQLLHYKPKQVILLDQGESPLYDLEFELKQTIKELDLFKVVVADICNYDRLRSVFEHFKPHMVFHAAAYKHVPLMEEHPVEGVSVNVFGTKNVADLSVDFGVEKFVMVSTDKAVNPTNVMGATKRVAEIYTQSLNGCSHVKTKFVTTRFGNVLGSNGSVIPLFRKQIENGGPLLVTHKEITRFFMTIPEACQLVLEAGTMGQGGEIFVFDMGESVKIYDIARKMIKLSGLEPDRDIKIEIMGLRPGEKLYEELLNVKENTTETHHPKIMIGKVREYAIADVVASLEGLEEMLSLQNTMGVVKSLKTIVPEYISQNSVFEQLDKEKVTTSS